MKEFVAHGYHCATNVCGVEVMLDRDFEMDPIVRYRVNGGDDFIGKEHRSKIRYNKKGEPYYMEWKTRVYLSEVMRI